MAEFTSLGSTKISCAQPQNSEANPGELRDLREEQRQVGEFCWPHSGRIAVLCLQNQEIRSWILLQIRSFIREKVIKQVIKKL